MLSRRNLVVNTLLVTERLLGLRGLVNVTIVVVLVVPQVVLSR